MSKDWCMEMADLEGDAEIGAGATDHPLRAQPIGDVEGLSKADRDLMEQAKKWGWPANELLAIIDRQSDALRRALPPQQHGVAMSQPTGDQLCHCELSGYVEVVSGEGPPTRCELCNKTECQSFDVKNVHDAFKWYQSELEKRLAHPTADVEGLSEEEREHLRWLKTAGVGSATITAELLAIIDRLNSRLIGLENTINPAATIRSLGSQLDLALRDVATAKARVAELAKALEPFAELAGGFDAHIYNDEKWPLLFKDEDHPVDERGPTIGDLRRARAALSTVAGEEKR
jgi:hypothetical protein